MINNVVFQMTQMYVGQLVVFNIVWNILIANELLTEVSFVDVFFLNKGIYLQDTAIF